MTRLLAVVVLLSILAGPLTPPAAFAQGGDPAAALLRRMTPEEKVGQLFLVSFTGTDVSELSTIYDLITNKHVGGVMLSAANDNFVAENTPQEANSLVESLQQIEAGSSETPAKSAAAHEYIPLFVGISQEGGGAPNDQILSGLTPIPDQMAIGATWDRSQAEQAGTVMGRELSELGFNLYLGLSLDVLTLPDPAVSADVTTRVFGGDPYWVSEMARAFTTGLHTGSNGRMAIIAKHFPGRGGSDRPASQEISTVRRSLDELKSIELAPFFAVTGNAAESKMNVDGLLVSHIRYQGFQGNIRATTRPISFDQQALSQIMALPVLAGWRQNGGLIISDNLGTQAVRRFYDPDYKNFSARLVARDAFLAGNDLLYMGNIVSSDAPDTYTSITRTLDFFAQRYREDTAFAARVDESVLRILKAKYHLYGTFSWENVKPVGYSPLDPSLAYEQVFAIARESATLISPSPTDLATVLPEPPNLFDYIVFLTDARVARQCSTCPDKSLLAKDALHTAVQRLYGPSASGLVTSSHLSSFSFDDLNLLLDGRQPTPDLLNALGRATWIVISTLDLPDGSMQMITLRRFLSEKQSLLNNKKVILFSFNAPYYLDATDISKLTAYYGMYSESEPFVNLAARLLFHELTPAGSLPVSVPGIGYDLISATTPDPAQVISLNLDLPKTALTPVVKLSATPGLTPGPLPTVAPSITPEPTLAPLYKVGDTISLRTGMILDHNHRQVPDGTPVKFTLAQRESELFQQVETVTNQGVAVAAFRLDRSGPIEIRVASEPAKTSDVIQLDVNKEGATVIIITPTESDSTPAPTATLPIPTPTSTPSPLVNTKGYPTFWGWLLVVLVLVAGVGLTYWLASQMVDSRWAVRWALLVLVGGLVAYNYLALGFPWGDIWLDGRGLPAFLQAVLMGQGAGFAVGWFWRLAAESGDQTQQQ
ncbi:MAG TPA: glycoside hydrolase family 3 N-terminal domain-containing protein [Anaerolineales bacterium]